MPDRAWYYSRGTAQLGPVNSAELKRLATVGQLAPADLVWCENMENWLPASTVKGLFPATVSAPAALSGIGVASIHSVNPGSHSASIGGSSEIGSGGVAMASAAQTIATPYAVTPQIHTVASVEPQANANNGGGYSAAQTTHLARQASQQAVGAFKELMTDPVGKIGSAYDRLGPSTAMIVGGVFVGGFVLCVVLAALIVKPSFIATSIPGLPILAMFEAKVFFKGLFALLLSIACLIGVATLFRVLSRTGTHFAGDLFMVGAALLPVGLVTLLTSVLNRGSEIVNSFIGALLVFAMITSFLILFSGFCKISRLTERMAGIAVATMFVSAVLLERLARWIMN